MPQADSRITSAASILTARRLGGEQGPRLPESCRPSDIEGALAIQSAVTAQLDECIAAWKCGLPADGRVIMAPIYSRDTHAESPCPAWVRQGKVRIEPELAFVLGQDLPARAQPYLPEDVDAAIARTHLALELIDTRYADAGAAGFVEHLADGLFNQGLFLGPQVDDALAREAAEMPISITLESGEDMRFDGRHPTTAPRAPLYWLAEFLRSRGQGLQAGQAVITGSYAGSIDVPAGQGLRIRYGALGELHVRLAPRAVP